MTWKVIYRGAGPMSHLSTEKELDSLGYIGNKPTQLYGDLL